MFRHLAFALALFAPLQAAALSCSAPPPFVDVLNGAGSFSGQAVVGYGQFSGGSDTATTLPPQTAQHFIATFDGVLFEGSKPNPVDQRAVTVTSECVSVWCGTPVGFIEEAGYLVVFDRHTMTGLLSISSGPCSPIYAVQLADLDLEKISQCLAKGSCTADDLGI